MGFNQFLSNEFGKMLWIRSIKMNSDSNVTAMCFLMAANSIGPYHVSSAEGAGGN